LFGLLFNEYSSRIAIKREIPLFTCILLCPVFDRLFSGMLCLTEIHVDYWNVIMAGQHNERNSYGVLILHGFTATLDSVAALCAPLRDLGIPVSMPLLAGHGASSPEALRGVGWEAWVADADKALQKLMLEAERVIVIGHSMGAILSLNLAIRYQGNIDSLVLAAPAIKLVSVFAPGRPLHFAAPFVSRVIRNWGLDSLYSGPQSVTSIPHYAWVPSDAIISLFELINQSLPLLGLVTVPVMILHCRQEKTVLPESATIVYNRVATEPSAKSIVWLEYSGHQIFCDCEKEKAIQTIIDYVSGRIGRNREKGDAGY
jgi:carboxylesterase